MFFGGLQDASGMMKVKGFAENAEKFYAVVRDGEIFEFQFARVGFAKTPNNFFLLKYELILAKETEVL